MLSEKSTQNLLQSDKNAEYRRAALSGGNSFSMDRDRTCWCRAAEKIKYPQQTANERGGASLRARTSPAFAQTRQENKNLGPSVRFGFGPVREPNSAAVTELHKN